MSREKAAEDHDGGSGSHRISPPPIIAIGNKGKTTLRRGDDDLRATRASCAGCTERRGAEIGGSFGSFQIGGWVMSWVSEILSCWGFFRVGRLPNPPNHCLFCSWRGSCDVRVCVSIDVATIVVASTVVVQHNRLGKDMDMAKHSHNTVQLQTD